MTMTSPDVGVLLVDDHAIVREGYRRLLEAEAGIRVVEEHATAEAAQAALERSNSRGDSASQGARAPWPRVWRATISPKTVSNVQTQIRTKLGVTTAIELLNHARQHGLLLD